MVKTMKDDDMGIILNYLSEEFANISNKKGILATLHYTLESATYRYVLETKEGLLIGYYVYSEITKNIADLSSVFIAPKYRHTKYARELWEHGAKSLYKYKLVKCNTVTSSQLMPKKYYNKHTKLFNIKKLYKKVVHNG